MSPSFGAIVSLDESTSVEAPLCGQNHDGVCHGCCGAFPGNEVSDLVARVLAVNLQSSVWTGSGLS